MNTTPLISIISVSYNCENDVKKTIESLLSQSFRDYEYIVVDGNSTDSTTTIVNEYRDGFPNFSIVSEPDKGIYDAMNKGVKMANGRYIYFLNMGDVFYDSLVLEKMAQEIADGAFDIYYGDVKQTDGLVIHQKGKATLWWAIYREFMICHQSIFAKRDWLLNYPFDLQFRICADRDWFIRCLRKGASVCYVAQCICIYDISGVSRELPKFQADSFSVSVLHGGRMAKAIVLLKRIVGKMML